MSKVLYSCKLIAVNPQRDGVLDDATFTKLIRYVKFTTLVYTNYFLTSPLITEAAFYDKEFYNKLETYKQIDPEIAEEAIKVLNWHTMYKSEQNITIALFSDNIDEIEKSKMSKKFYLRLIVAQNASWYQHFFGRNIFCGSFFTEDDL